ncbi:LysR substrate-binding domain-containing protein [Rhodoligotrophos defluvii]|uniref:LysR substrate-binding domain-containing protein n=1 Tax=Rhodoligotrophos defluvii TaxID=2561934 RepID=UPI0010C9B55C|nr:LysR substrate-binding domain-containing protein [Rhodoligotrophos defluvii]
MSYRLPHLQWLRAFEAAARHESFSAAARELNLTPAAVSHQTRCLEQHLGHALFERLARGVRLSDMGKAYLPSVRKAFDELSVSTVGIFGAKLGATVSVRAPVSFAALRLAPCLRAFAAAYPGIHVRLQTAIWADALSMEDVDLDIRFGDGRWADADAISLGPEGSILVCTRRFAEECSFDIAQMASRGVIQIMGCEDRWASLIGKAGDATLRSVEVASVDNSLVGLELASTGLGCLLVLRTLASPYLQASRLIEPIPALEVEHDQSHYILMNAESRRHPEAHLLREWLMTNLAVRRAAADE